MVSGSSSATCGTDGDGIICDSAAHGASRDTKRSGATITPATVGSRLLPGKIRNFSFCTHGRLPLGPARSTAAQHFIVKNNGFTMRLPWSFCQAFDDAIENHAAPQQATSRKNAEQCKRLKRARFPPFIGRGKPKTPIASLPEIHAQFLSFILPSTPICTGTSIAF